MADIKKLTLDVKGALIIPDPTLPGQVKKVVFQGCSNQFANYRTGHGQPRMQRTYVKVVNPKTPAQRIQQAAMTAAVATWKMATPEQKESARPAANAKHITLYMAFIGIFIKNYQQPLGTLWDNVITKWDNGATNWDNGTTEFDYVPLTTWDNGSTNWDI